MQTLLKLTEATTNKTILVGVESIIVVERATKKPYNGNAYECTQIESRGAMVTTVEVNETPEEIYEQYSK